MPEDYDDTLRRHQEMLEGLARVWHAQHDINVRLDAAIAELREFNRQQVAINADMKTLLAEMIRERHNGRNA